MRRHRAKYFTITIFYVPVVFDLTDEQISRSPIRVCADMTLFEHHVAK